MKNLLFIIFFFFACHNNDNDKKDRLTKPIREKSLYNLKYEKKLGLIWEQDSLTLSILPHGLFFENGKEVESALCRIGKNKDGLTLSFFDTAINIASGVQNIHLICSTELSPTSGSFNEIIFNIPCDKLFESILSETDINLKSKCEIHENTILNTQFFKERYQILGSVENDLGLDIFNLYEEYSGNDYRTIDNLLLKKMQGTIPELYKQMTKNVPANTLHFYDTYLSLTNFFEKIINQNKYPVQFYPATSIKKIDSTGLRFRIEALNITLNKWSIGMRYFILNNKKYYSDGNVVFTFK
jgi:hypothetical protein